MSQARGLTLCMAVLQSLPTYHMSTTLLVKSILQKIKALVRKFWWQWHNQGNIVHLVAWQTLIKPIQDGGSSLFNMEALNKALLAK